MHCFSFYDTRNIFNYLFLCLCFFQIQAVGQKQKTLDKDILIKKYASLSSNTYSEAKPYYVFKKTGDKLRVKTVRPLHEEVDIIAISSKAEFDLLNTQVELIPANDNWKFSPSLERLGKGNSTDKYILSGHNIEEMLRSLKHKKVSIVLINRPSNSVIIKCTKRYLLDELLPLKEIIFIDEATTAHPETNIIGYDRSFHGINAVDFLLPGANGKGIVAGVKEQRMDEGDIDLWKRVLSSPIAGSVITSHATVIASIIGGAGNSFYDGRGIAWGCSFFSSTFANLFADDASILNANKVTVQNHSYGTVIQQFYGAEAVSYDLLAWNNKNYVAVVSAGNQGTAAAAEGKYANIPGFANLTGNFKMAKNIITVGGIDNKEFVSPQSSAGPLYDGRIAPQLTALGPNGTSDASAIVTGTIAVMQQVYADSNNKNLPLASLTKAILYNTADDIYLPGIDYKTGYGLLNSYEAIKAIQQRKFDGSILSSSLQWTRTITVPANAAQLKVTLSWTDSASIVNNNKALLNDLDLEIKNLNSGVVYQPWVLNSAAHKDSLTKPATRKRDSLNTAEQVSIPLPEASNYQVTVKATSLATSILPFHIAYNIDTLNSFQFTSPLHASDINRQENENLTIRWKTFVTDTTQTGNLYISYDNNASWQLIQSSVKLTNRKHQWQIKDTNTVASLRMATPFGDFISNSFIIGRLTRPAVDFNCTDSFRLSWNKHVYAIGYRIYTLTDSPYLKIIRTVSDTFTVFNKAGATSPVYAVEPILNSGLPAARSVAINVEAQGVQCFYKTLNYNLLDFNKLDMILELSLANYADSIYFEKVNQNGMLLQTYGAVKANSIDLIYSLMVDKVLQGTTYLRGKIKLHNGTIVYTNIISVLTTGEKYIRFYPNPAKRNISLQRVIRQGLPTETRLQFFDSYGRLIKNYDSLPDKINLSLFSAGVFIYKLVDSDNKIIETGKLIIQ